MSNQHGQGIEPGEYAGYGICPNGCGGHDKHGRRASTIGRRRLEDDTTTVDRCEECRGEWMQRDGQRRWYPY